MIILQYYAALTIDKDGTIYFSDTLNIRKITKNGRIYTIIGSNLHTLVLPQMPCNIPINLAKVRIEIHFYFTLTLIIIY